MTDLKVTSRENAVAVVGMAGRFPDAPNVEQFWENLRAGHAAIKQVADPSGDIAANGNAASGRFVPVSARLEDNDKFDAAFFGISPREAEIMDPQHRLFLECAWEAIESAGNNPAPCSKLVGVFGSTNTSSYLAAIMPALRRRDAIDTLEVKIGNDKDYLATRVSHKLNLRGPSVCVQSACSSSLVAVHMACQSLLAFECDVALAGGVSIDLGVADGYWWSEGGILSADGCCRPFDAHANGTVVGSGVGVVVLKRYDEALADGDFIRAIIIGSAINNDGGGKAFYTAPSVDGHAAVVEQAFAVADVPFDSVSYIEAHGTGTLIGDPIEIEGLTRAFRRTTSATRFCAIGSVKSSIGHLDVAAGVASLIKTILMLEHQMIVPSLHWSAPNPKIDFDGSPFYVAAELAAWRTNDGPRRAGVSSLGMGGTNCHIVLEEAPALPPRSATAHPAVVPLSARTPPALHHAMRNCRDHVRRHPDIDLRDLAYTYQMGRQHFAHRRVMVASTVDELVRAIDGQSWYQAEAKPHEPDVMPVVFIFSGQGTQFFRMGAELYASEPVFRSRVDLCCTSLLQLLGVDLREIMYGAGPGTLADGRLEQTQFTQPALFVTEYALAAQWMNWSIRPSAMVGHSIGEYVAACLADVFSIQDGLRIVAERAKLMQSMPAGAMLAVQLGERDIERFLRAGLAIAAVNAPTLTVVAGSVPDVREMEQHLTAARVGFQRLSVSHAFHSPAMQPLATALEESIGKLTLRAPSIPIMSSVTGTQMTDEQAVDPHYWAQQLCRPVRFMDCLRKLLSRENAVFIEVGPGRSGAFCIDAVAEGATRIVLPSLAASTGSRSDSVTIRESLGSLWAQGVDVNWADLQRGEAGRPVPLPTYPFERHRFWVDAEEITRGPPAGAATPGLLHAPTWAQQRPLAKAADRMSNGRSQGRWLVFADEHGIGRLLVERLRAIGREVVVARNGGDFAGEGLEFRLDIARGEHYRRLIGDLVSRGFRPDRVVHLCGVTGGPGGLTPWQGENGRGVKLMASLMLLANALEEHLQGHPTGLEIVVDGLFDVTGAEPLMPEKGLMLGLSRVLPLECPDLTVRCFDVSLDGAATHDASPRWAGQLVDEILREGGESLVAYRGDHRFVRRFEPLTADQLEYTLGTIIRRKGVYLITGGLGGLGSVIARHLATTAEVRLVLVNRSSLPRRSEWEALLASDSGPAEMKRRILMVQELERIGSAPTIIQADVCDQTALAGVIDQVVHRHGAIHGVVHAAGVPGRNLMRTKTLHEALEVLRPKMAGTINLLSALAGHAPDFVVLFSSMTALVGGLGQADYAAANAFLDAAAHACRRYHRLPVTSINWGAWSLDSWTQQGLAALPHLRTQIKQVREAYGFAPEEGCRLWELAAASGMPQVAISRQKVADALRAEQLLARSQLVVQGAKPRHARPLADETFMAPRTPLEREIAELWQDVLGVDQVGAEDEFVRLGGHSLLAVQLARKMREKFQTQIELRALMEKTTVAKMAAFIEERAAGVEDQEFAEILAQVEGLSREEVEAVLAAIEMRTTNAQ
jgi:phthiocerol/phenolphthiocerol synthesis type-I polyketide synthase E